MAERPLNAFEVGAVPLEVLLASLPLSLPLLEEAALAESLTFAMRVASKGQSAVEATISAVTPVRRQAQGEGVRTRNEGAHANEMGDAAHGCLAKRNTQV